MQRTYFRIVEELVSRGHEVVLLVNEWQGERPRGVEVKEFALSAPTNHGLNMAFAEAVGEWRRRHEIDLLVGFNKIPGLDVYYAGDPCFAETCERKGRGFFYRLTPRYRGMRSLEASVFDWGLDPEILMISAGEKAKFQKHYDTEDERFHLLPPGIDRARLDRQLGLPSDRQSFLTDLGLDPADKMILIVGSGFHTKGVDRLMMAVGSLPTTLDSFYSLVVVGAGDSAALKKSAKRLGIGARCVFTGPRSDIVNFYRHADLLAHPARLENTGTTLIEAMYCGLPVFATACCGFAHHVIQADAGLICPEPFEQEVFDGMLLGALLAPQREKWRKNGPIYCRRNDLYSLIESGVDVIVDAGTKRRLGQ